LNPVLQSLKSVCNRAAQHTQNKQHEQHFDQTVTFRFESELHGQSIHAWRTQALASADILDSLQVNVTGATC
jgi:hypothetical protein